MQVQEGAGLNPFKNIGRIYADRAADAAVQYQAPEAVAEQYVAAVDELNDPRRKKYVDDLFDANNASYDKARRAFDERNYALVAFINAQMKSVATDFLTSEIARLQDVIAPMEASETAGNAADLLLLTELQVELMMYEAELATYKSPSEYDKKIKMKHIKYQRDTISPKDVDLTAADEFIADLRKRQADIVLYRDVEKYATDVAYMRKKDVDYRTKNSAATKLYDKLERVYRGYQDAFNRNRVADCANSKAIQDMIRTLELAKEKQSLEVKFPGTLNAIRRAYHAYAADVRFTNDAKNESKCVPETYKKPEYVPPEQRSMKSVKEFVVDNISQSNPDAHKINKLRAWLDTWAPTESIDESDFKANESVEDLKAQLQQCIEREKRMMMKNAMNVDRKFFTHEPKRSAEFYNITGGARTHNYAVSACLAAIVMIVSVIQ